jgi:hypothetical protein
MTRIATCRASRASIAISTLACLSLFACLQVSTGNGTTGSASGTSADGGAAEEGGSGLSECGTDPATGVTLCLQSSACPGMTIDNGAFPECGFHQGGASLLDIECLCNGNELCPVGVPTSCGAVQQLLTQEQSALQVCQQVSQQGAGGCISLQDAGGGSSTTGGLSSECQACISGCGGTPACFQSCGC